MLCHLLPPFELIINQSAKSKTRTGPAGGLVGHLLSNFFSAIIVGSVEIAWLSLFNLQGADIELNMELVNKKAGFPAVNQ
jgi:hypothetical protein